MGISTPGAGLVVSVDGWHLYLPWQLEGSRHGVVVAKGFGLSVGCACVFLFSVEEDTPCLTHTWEWHGREMGVLNYICMMEGAQIGRRHIRRVFKKSRLDDWSALAQRS